MKWKFLKVRLKKFENFPSEWVLKIETHEELDEYIKTTCPKRFQNTIQDALKCTKYDHSRNMLTAVSNTVSMTNKTSWLKGFFQLVNDWEMGWRKVIDDGKIIYMKPNGSYAPETKDGQLYEILKIKENDEYKWPQLEPRFSQWPGGIHWYVKFGEEDFEWEGKQKWDSLKAAEDAYNNFVGKNFENNKW
jgi:hypothetical protein